METERIVRDYTEVDLGNGVKQFIPSPPIDYFRFERRPIPKKSYRNVIVTVLCSIASFFAGASLIGMAFYPLLSTLAFVISLAFILLVLYANTWQKKE